jgi:hypothetical protein
MLSKKQMGRVVARLREALMRNQVPQLIRLVQADANLRQVASTLVPWFKHLSAAVDKNWDEAAYRVISRVRGMFRLYQEKHRELADAYQNCLTEHRDSFGRDRRRIQPRELWLDLQELQAEYPAVEFNWEKNRLEVTTRPVVLQDLSFGPMQMCLRLKHLSTRSPGYLLIKPVSPFYDLVGQGFIHPHVSEGRLCMGEGAASARNALEGGYLAEFFRIVNSVLNTYYSGSPHQRIQAWMPEEARNLRRDRGLSDDGDEDGVHCDDCGENVSDDYIGTCRDCEIWICDECSRWCERCGVRLCSEHTYACETCSDTYCSEHSTSCDSCDCPACPNCRVHFIPAPGQTEDDYTRVFCSRSCRLDWCEHIADEPVQGDPSVDVQRSQQDQNSHFLDEGGNCECLTCERRRVPRPPRPPRLDQTVPPVIDEFLTTNLPGAGPDAFGDGITAPAADLWRVITPSLSAIFEERWDVDPAEAERQGLATGFTENPSTDYVRGFITSVPPEESTDGGVQPGGVAEAPVDVPDSGD